MTICKSGRGLLTRMISEFQPPAAWESIFLGIRLLWHGVLLHHSSWRIYILLILFPWKTLANISLWSRSLRNLNQDTHTVFLKQSRHLLDTETRLFHGESSSCCRLSLALSFCYMLQFSGFPLLCYSNPSHPILTSSYPVCTLQLFQMIPIENEFPTS